MIKLRYNLKLRFEEEFILDILIGYRSFRHLYRLTPYYISIYNIVASI